MDIHKDNYTDFAPEELAAGLSNGTFNLVETGIGALIDIVKYIAEAVHSGPRIKRIRALEEYRDANVKLMDALAKQMTAFGDRLTKLENK